MHKLREEAAHHRSLLSAQSTDTISAALLAVRVDVPPSILPPQGRTQVAAAEDVEARNGREGAGPSVAYTVLGEIVAAYPWPINEAFRIVDCESRWDPNAVSWDGSSWGLWQINAVHFWRWPNAWNEWDNPEVNTAWAYELWLEQGWGIWSCW